ncbi:MAG: hypothetical protein ACRDG3_13750, partial [Tepidiformaceae bacterium]
MATIVRRVRPYTSVAQILRWTVGAAALAGALIGGIACSGSDPSAASTAVPMGGGTFGFWVSDAASIKDAVQQVDAKTGLQTHVPDAVPPGFALKSVSEARTPPTDPNK